MKKAKPSDANAGKDAEVLAKRFIRHYDKRVRKLKKSMLVAQRYFAVDGIHDLRVEIKKLRVLIRLAASITRGIDAKSEIARMKEVFKTAGELRDIDVRQSQVFPFPKGFDTSAYFNYLKARELELRPAFLTAAEKFDFGRLADVRKTILSEFKMLSAEKVSAGMQTALRRESRSLLLLARKMKLTDEILHEIRKHAKVIRYLLDTWAACFKATAEIERLIASYKRVYDTLGEMLDLQMTIESIKSFLQKHLSTEFTNRNSYARFLKKSSKRIASLRSNSRISYNTVVGISERLMISMTK